MLKINKIAKVMLVSVITNITLAFMKIISGLLFHSVALISDGVHSFSDLITDFCAIIGNKLARKPADLKHPYGHGKMEYITSILIGIVVLVVGLGVIYKATTNEIVIPSVLVVIVSLITIILKYILSMYIINKGQKYNNQILIASGKESKTDVISSIVVLVASILMQFSTTINWLKYADMIASIIVGIFICHTGFSVIKENVSIIIGEQVTDTNYINKLKEVIIQNCEDCEIASLVILKFGHIYNLSLTLKMNGDTSLHDIHKQVDSIEDNIKQYDNNIAYINVHMEPLIK